MNIAFTGGRSYDNFNEVRRVVSMIDSKHTFLVGDAAGLDRLVRSLCREQNLNCIVFVADWDKYGKIAGPRRNNEMLNFEADMLVAFPGGRGTADCVSQARHLNIPVLFVGE